MNGAVQNVSQTKSFFTRSATTCLSLSVFFWCSFPDVLSPDFDSATSSSSSMSIDQIMSTSELPSHVKLEGSGVEDDVDGRLESTDWTKATKVAGVNCVCFDHNESVAVRRVL